MVFKFVLLAIKADGTRASARAVWVYVAQSKLYAL